MLLIIHTLKVKGLGLSLINHNIADKKSVFLYMSTESHKGLQVAHNLYKS